MNELTHTCDEEHRFNHNVEAAEENRPALFNRTFEVVKQQHSRHQHRDRNGQSVCRLHVLRRPEEQQNRAGDDTQQPVDVLNVDLPPGHAWVFNKHPWQQLEPFRLFYEGERPGD